MGNIADGAFCIREERILRRPLDARVHKEAGMKEYAVVYERGDSNWGAIVPDLPGCVSIGDTLEEVQQNVKEAIALYLEILAERSGFDDLRENS